MSTIYRSLTEVNKFLNDPPFAGFDQDTKRHVTFSGDLDTVLWNSVYGISSGGVTNGPANLTTGSGFVHTLMSPGGTSLGTQIIYSSETAAGAYRIWMRHREGGVWGAWAVVVDGDVSTYTRQSSDTGSSLVPTGTTAQRDGTPAAGMFRFNSDTSQFEGHNGTAWGAVGGGATGGGGDQVFVMNDLTVNNDFTIPATKGAHSVGPITVNAVVTVDGVWVIS